jgi:hypothetical protein
MLTNGMPLWELQTKCRNVLIFTLCKGVVPLRSQNSYLLCSSTEHYGVEATVLLYSGKAVFSYPRRPHSLKKTVFLGPPYWDDA